MRPKKTKDVRSELVDVQEHLDRLRTHYFDIVSVSDGEICVTLRRKAASARPIGFRSRRDG